MDKIIKTKDRQFGFLSAEYKVAGKAITICKSYNQEGERKWHVEDYHTNNLDDEDRDSYFDSFAEAKEFALKIAK